MNAFHDDDESLPRIPAFLPFFFMLQSWCKWQGGGYSGVAVGEHSGSSSGCITMDHTINNQDPRYKNLHIPLCQLLFFLLLSTMCYYAPPYPYLLTNLAGRRCQLGGFSTT